MKLIHIHGVWPLYTNTFLLITAVGHAVVVDPAAEAETYLAQLKENNATLTDIFLTHGHYDHTGAVPALLRTLPPTAVYIHEADFDFPSPQLFPLKTELTQGALGGVSFYGEGDRITVGTLELQVLHTPGHSKGSVTLKVADVLFCGDTLFAGSCGRTDLRGGSYEQIMQSLKRLGELKGDFHVCPGHEATSTLERERRSNPFLMEAMRS